MKESEAKTKWCPFVRLTDDFGDNRPSGGAAETFLTCIGSECMAWRWEVSPTELARRGQQQNLGEYVKPTGFCGLAGKP